MSKVHSNLSKKVVANPPPQSRGKKGGKAATALKATAIALVVIVPLAALIVGVLGAHHIAYFGAFNAYSELLIRGGLVGTSLGLVILALLYAGTEKKKIKPNNKENKAPTPPTPKKPSSDKASSTDSINFNNEVRKWSEERLRKPQKYSPTLRSTPTIHFPSDSRFARE